MVVLKGKVSDVKVHANLVWFHTATKQGSGWISMSKGLFDAIYRERLVKELYSRHNKDISRKIRKLEKEIKFLRRDGEKEGEITSRENQINELMKKIKTDLHLNDLIGKRIRLKIV